MDSKHTSETVGVIGAGSFGTALANLISQNTHKVLLYAKGDEKVKKIAKNRQSAGQKLAENIEVTGDLSSIASQCPIIFPAIPSADFRKMILELAPYLRPYHMIIHGTKGFDYVNDGSPLSRDQVNTMSEVIRKETTVVRVGCIAGPNLASEIAAQKPAATVVASQFDEVVEKGQKLLKNDHFLVYGGKDLIGTELCGILKNVIAVGAGLLHGLKMGENAKAFLISRGLVEMIHIGQAFGADVKSFLGLAGVGDLVATCGSSLSRNFTVGTKLAEGKTIEEIMGSMEEVAEGVKTIEIVRRLGEIYKFRCVITELLYKIIYEDLSIKQAQTFLMKLPFRQEVDFID